MYFNEILNALKVANILLGAKMVLKVDFMPLKSSAFNQLKVWAGAKIGQISENHSLTFPPKSARN